MVRPTFLKKIFSFRKGQADILRSFSKGPADVLGHMLVSTKWNQHVINFLKRKFLSDDRAWFLDLKSIWIILIASFLIEINAKYLKKAGDENLAKSKFGSYYWWWLFWHEFTWCYVPLNFIYIFVCIWGHNMT